MRWPRTVVALGLTSFFTDVSSELVFSVMPAFLASLGAGPAFLGLLEGVADATAAVLKYQSGRWSDLAPGKKPLILLGYGLSSATRPVRAVVSAPLHVFVLRVVDRVGKGLRTSPRDALLAGAVPESERARAFGFHQAMDHAGAVVGPLLGAGLLAFGLELPVIFLMTALPGVLAVGSVALIRETPGEVAGARPSAAEPLSPALRGLLACGALFALGAATDGFVLLRASALGTPLWAVPLLWTVLNGSKMTFAALGGRWGDRFERHRVLLGAWMVFVLVMLGFGASATAWHVWALALVAGAWQGLSEPVLKAMVAQLAPRGGTGRAFGWLNGLKGAMAVPAGVGFGLLWQQVSASSAFFASAGIGLFACVALVAWAGRHLERARVG
jgi:MFS family permease